MTDIRLAPRTIIILYLLGLSGCWMLAGDERDVLMPVDSVTVPSEGSIGEPVRSTFTGTLAGSCQRFKRLEVIQAGRHFDVTMIAREPTNPRWECTEEAESITRSHAFVPREPGTYVIRVIQPPNRPDQTVRSVVVR